MVTVRKSPAGGAGDAVFTRHSLDDRPQCVLLQHDLDMNLLALHQVAGVADQEPLCFLRDKGFKGRKAAAILYWPGAVLNGCHWHIPLRRARISRLVSAL